jgi:prepilin-type N-terminal cleavage/methylation domain-containing protein
MRRLLPGSPGFTLVELMVVLVVLGLIALIAIPNWIAMAARAKEGTTKANMHTFQVSAEDCAVVADGIYPGVADSVARAMPGGGAGFRNPFSSLTGSGVAWEDRGSVAADPTLVPGLVSYADAAGTSYNIKGVGQTSVLSLVLSPGQ